MRDAPDTCVGEVRENAVAKLADIGTNLANLGAMRAELVGRIQPTLSKTSSGGRIGGKIRFFLKTLVLRA